MADPIAWTTGEAFTRANEGVRYAAYDDATGEAVPADGFCRGSLTIGIGHTGPDVTPGLIWSQAQCDHAFMIDYASASFQARKDIGPAIFDAIDPARKAALVDMAFQLGGRGLARFAELVAAVQRRDWPSAAAAARASLWARKVARRAARVEALLETGDFP